MAPDNAGSLTILSHASTHTPAGALPRVWKTWWKT